MPQLQSIVATPLGLVRRAAALAAAIAAALAAIPAAAQGDLLVAPTRVVINGGGNAEVILSNTGSQPATYRISLELRRMTEEGEIEAVADADATDAERAALDMVRYAPRRITLLPGQPQSVRISIRPPAGLADGEYRVHMNFRAIPPVTPAEDAQSAATSGISIKLVPVYGITIPVIMRKGRLDAAASLANPHLVHGPNGTYLELDMSRSGQRSTYGELIGKTARGEAIFDLKGIAIYPELTHRVARVPLNAEQVARFNGPVRIQYRELPENGGGLIAETTANFP